MFDKLKELSKIFVAVGIIFYLFGFVTLTSYLGRFGIISFDIINSRVIIAGMHTFLAIGACLIIAGYLYKRFPIAIFTSLDKWKERIGGYVHSFTFIAIVSSVFTKFYNLGEYKPPLETGAYEFKRLFGQYDVVGWFFELPEVKKDTFSYVFLYTGYTFVYISMLLAAFFLATELYKKRRGEASPRPEAAVVTDEGRVAKPRSAQRRYLMVLFEVLMVCFFVTLFFGAHKKLGASLYDFTSFQGGSSLDSNLTFAWFYTTSVGAYVFLTFLFPKDGRVTFDFEALSNLSSLHNIQFTFQHLVIPVFYALILFGQTIFPRISFAMGGGQPREVTVGMRMEAHLNLRGQTFLLGESSQYIFVADCGDGEAEVLQINKDRINFIQTRRTL